MINSTPDKPDSKLCSAAPITQVMRACGQARCKARTAGTRLQQSPKADSRNIHIVGARVEFDPMMTFQEKRGSGYRILYEPSTASQIEPEWFEPQYWQQQGRLLGGAPGRGTSCFVQGPQQGFVLRHYHRGGLVGKLLKDIYLWTGLHRSRPWQEMHMLAALWSKGLPVPAPVAARIQRYGLIWYSADLITATLPDVEPLAEVIHQLPMALLQNVGSTVRRFHEEGLYHVDLNPRNIVINLITEEVFILDFDRCRLFDGALDPLRARRNLDRLHRGLVKVDATQAATWNDIIQRAYYHA